MHSPAPGNAPRRAKAWDLFYHMRYVAHPSPTISLYSEMIRACAETPEPETLRGFDLWTEMTVDKRMAPTTEAYNAIIALAARSKSTALDATRLAKEMIESGRDAQGRPAMPLTKDAYIALLEAAKRLGDLRQARWLLMKLVRAGKDGSSAVDHWALRHVFHTYAMYAPPFKRELAAVRTGTSTNRKDQVSRPAKNTQTTEGTSDSLPDVHATSNTTTTGYNALLPQTSRAVLAEADALFELFLREKSSPQDEPASSPPLFSEVSNLPDVVSAYLSVYLHHAPSFATVVAKARSVHARLNLDWSADVIRTCMVHCARRTRSDSSSLANEWADELWAAWGSLVEHEKGWMSRWIPGGPSTPAERRIIPRSTIRASTVSTVWAAYVQVKAKCVEIHHG